MIQLTSDGSAPQERMLPKGTHLRLASDNLRCLVSLSQQMEKNLPLIFVETISGVKMDAQPIYKKMVSKSNQLGDWL